MKTRVLLLAVCTVAQSLTSWGAVGAWRNFTSMREVRGMMREGTTYWAATSGGLFGWNSTSNAFRQFTNADGLQSTDLTAVGIDKDGNIWTGTSTGLIHVYSQSAGSWRYILDIATNSGQTNKRINSFTMAGDTVFVCTEFGVSVFRRGSFGFGDTYTQFGSLQGSIRVAVSSAVIFNDSLWLAVTDQNIGRVAVGSLASPNLQPPESWTLQVVGAVNVLPRQLTVFNNQLYAATSAGLYSYASGSWTSLPALAGQSVVGLSASSTVLSVITQGEAYTVDVQGNVSQIGSAFPSIAACVVSSPAGQPVVGTIGNGTTTFDSVWTPHFPDGPNSNFFINLTVGTDGSLWSATATTGGSGVNRFDGKNWRSYTAQNNGLPSNNCYRVSTGCNGSVWISTWGKGVAELLPGVEQVDSAHVYGRNVGMVGVPGDTNFIVVSTVICDGRGNHWMSINQAADSRILAVRKANGSWLTLPLKVSSGSVTTMFNALALDRIFTLDASDNLWGIAREGNRQGAFSLNNGGAVDDSADFFLTADDGLPTSDVTTIVVDRDNTVWIGTNQGIAIVLDPYQPKRSGSIAAYVPLRGAVINCIAVDALNQKWVGTTDGVVVLSPDGTQQIAAYTVASTSGKLIDNNIKSIAIDHSSGTVYFGTLAGLASLQTFSVTTRTSFEDLKIRPKLFVVPSDSLMTIGSLNGKALGGLFENWTLKILSIDGRLVREIRTTNQSIAQWDGRDSQGKYVASGVYIAVAYSEDGTSVAKGKLAVIRR